MKSSSKATLPSSLAKQLSARKRKPVRITSNSRSPQQAKVASYGALPLPYEVQRELLSPVKTNRNSNQVRLEPVTSERKSLVCERILKNLSGQPQPPEPYMKKTNKCLFPDAQQRPSIESSRLSKEPKKFDCNAIRPVLLRKNQDPKKTLKILRDNSLAKES